METIKKLTKVEKRYLARERRWKRRIEKIEDEAGKQFRKEYDYLFAEVKAGV